MKSSLKIVLFIGTMLTLFNCEMQYHPYSTKIKGECDMNAKNIAKIEAACKEKDTLRFAIISDTQRWYDETEKAVKHINQQSDIDFVMHLGDLSDVGITNEFERPRDLLKKLNIPFVVLIGNHDCLANGNLIYR